MGISDIIEWLRRAWFDWGIPGWASILGAVVATVSLVYALRQRKRAKALSDIARGAIVAAELCCKCREVSRLLELKHADSAKGVLQDLRVEFQWLHLNHEMSRIVRDVEWPALGANIEFVERKVNGFKKNTALKEIKEVRNVLGDIGAELKEVSIGCERHMGRSK